MDQDHSNIINQADTEYVQSVFNALMNFQAIEELLKKCILTSYQIVTASCHEGVEFSPSTKTVKDIKEKLGLGQLVNKFEEVTPHKELCSRISSLSRTRNNLAHIAAAQYLKFPVSIGGAETCLGEAEDFRKASDEANRLFHELNDIYNNLKEVHGQLV